MKKMFLFILLVSLFVCSKNAQAYSSSHDTKKYAVAATVGVLTAIPLVVLNSCIGCHRHKHYAPVLHKNHNRVIHHRSIHRKNFHNF